MVRNDFNWPTIIQEEGPAVKDDEIVVPDSRILEPAHLNNTTRDISILLCSYLADIPNGAKLE